MAEANPALATYALEAHAVEPLRIPGWTVNPYEIQSRGIVWLYASPRGFLGDITGTGKTIIGIGLVALLRAKRELHKGKPAIFCVLSGTVGQWMGEFAKFLPDCQVVTNQGMNKADRRRLYQSDFEVLVTPYGLAWRDAPILAGLCPELLWADESGAFKDRTTKTAEGLRILSSVSARVVEANATPLENGMMDWFSQLEVLGLAGTADSLFGNEFQFKAQYVIERPETFFVKGGMQRTKMVTVGWKNLDHFRDKIAPYYLRRTEGSADMPDVAPPTDVWLEMLPAQYEQYKALAEGKVAPDNDAEVSKSGRLWYLLQACAGLGTLGGPDESVKLDWLMEFLQGEAAGEKVVVYSRWLNTIHHLGHRLNAAGIGYGVITGHQTGPEKDAVKARFWSDPECRVIIGTSAIEKGHNLQIAKYVVTIDLLFNPSRVEQIVGRVKRSGSPHSTVFLIRLMLANSIEEGILRTLRQKQSLADYINAEESELFEALSEEELDTIIRTGLARG